MSEPITSVGDGVAARLAAAQTRLAERVGEDGVHHIQSLVRALEARDVSIFTDYARRVRVTSCARGMCSRHLVESLERLSEAIGAEGWSDAHDAQRVLRAGAAALAYADGDAGAIDGMAARLVRARGEKPPHLDVFASYLADALAFGEPGRFASYVGFAADRYGREVARGVLAALRDAVAAQLGGASSSLAGCLEQAETSLGGGNGPPDFSALAGESREFALECDAAGCLSYADARARRLLGLGVGDRLEAAMFPGVEDKLRMFLAKSRTERTRGWELVFDVGGRPVSASMSAAASRDGILIVGQVIEGFVEALEQVSRIVVETVGESRSLLEEKRRELSDVVEAMSEGVILQDADGSIVASNHAAELLLGRRADELLGATSLAPSWPAMGDDGAPFRFEEHPAVLARTSKRSHRDVVMRLEKPDGTTTWLSVSSLPRLAASGAVSQVITTLHDITELRRANERSAHSERLAMAGTLAAGVGHEINNPLTYMFGSLEESAEVLRRLDPASTSVDVRALLELNARTLDGAQRIRRIVRALRTVSRADAELASVAVASAVEHALSLSAHEVRRKARVDVGELDVPAVLVEESGLTQVLVNLLVNAAKSFASADVSRNRISIAAAVRGDGSIVISVTDNGPGVPEKVRSRIFDPFFTTRPVGEGTGLGLFVSRNIIAGFGGTLTLEPSSSLGASFSIVLRPAPAEVAPPHPVVTPPPERARILVVDDDLPVLKALTRVLSTDYEVSSTHDPEHAMQLLAGGAAVDVVLCDLRMPTLSGEALYARVAALRPELAGRFVFMTGGGTPTSDEVLPVARSVPRVDKPFTPQVLRTAIRSVLGEED